MRRTYKIATLGCKVNQQESETIAERFEALGFFPAGRGEGANVCVINSCTVTSMAGSKTRQKIRQARAGNPGALVCVVGCLPEVEREAVLAMPDVDIVVGSVDKERVAGLAFEILTERMITTEHEPQALERYTALRSARQDSSAVLSSDSVLSSDAVLSSERYMVENIATGGTRTRAFLKAQDGCDRFCAYCIIPYARGPVRSKPAADVVREAEGLLAEGYKELVLTGVNLALYGQEKDSKDARLCSLVEMLCALETAGEYRVRLGSLEPAVFGVGEALRIASIRGVCPQFHLSLQSGAARTLETMGRPYTPEEYAGIVEALHGLDPLFSVTTDVIVGFPGETDGDFEESLEFVRKMGFAHVHVFKYSRRPGTRAAGMADQVTENVKNERGRRMIEAAEEGALRFLKQNEGRTRRALIFGPDKTGRFVRGLTDNGIDIRLTRSSGAYPPNEFADIELNTTLFY